MSEFLTWLGKFFGGVGHIFFSFIAQAIPLEKQIILNDLAPLAAPIVADLENQNLTWQEKRDQALALLTAAAVKLGWDVGTSLMNLAIELAVQNLQTTKAGNGGNLPGGDTNSTTTLTV